MKKLNTFVAMVGSINCLYVSILFISFQLDAQNSIWSIFPTPGIYLFEIALIGIVGFISYTQKKANTLWGICGVLLVLVILGVWSIGIYLIPSFICFIILAFQFSNKSHKKVYLKSFFSAFLIQLIGMISFIL